MSVIESYKTIDSVKEPVILDIHRKCFRFLNNCVIDGEELLFLPRRKDKKPQRREDGYYFIGNKEYLQITFWSGDDTKEKIHNISFMIWSDGTSYIEISSTDNDIKAERVRALVNYLTKNTGLKFDEKRLNKWNARLKNDDYLENLNSFIKVEKKLMDGFIESECAGLLKPLEKEYCKKYIDIIKKIDEKYLEDHSDSETNKLEGTLHINKSEYQMSFLHNAIQNCLKDILNTSGNYKSVKMEQNHVDITGFREDGKLDFYELKIGKAKSAIREALGQILEYNHYPSQEKAERMFIVSIERPTEDDIAYLNHLRAVYGMNLYYRYFNVVDNVLSDSY